MPNAATHVSDALASYLVSRALSSPDATCNLQLRQQARHTRRGAGWRATVRVLVRLLFHPVSHEAPRSRQCCLTTSHRKTVTRRDQPRR